MTDNAEFPNQVHRKLQAGFPFLDCFTYTHGPAICHAKTKSKVSRPNTSKAFFDPPRALCLCPNCAPEWLNQESRQEQGTVCGTHKQTARQLSVIHLSFLLEHTLNMVADLLGAILQAT